jgi:hypothetical protein
MTVRSYRKLPVGAVPVLLLALIAGSGCTSTAIHEASSGYYVEGPEKTLRVLEYAKIRSEDRMLASMEQAVALQELGAYEKSNQALAASVRQLESTPPEPLRWLVNDEAGSYRGEYFERVYLHTLAIANWLALQQAEFAVEEAENALASIEAVSCARCRFSFTRYLAALAFEAAGQEDRAVEILAEATAENPWSSFLRTEWHRVSQKLDLGPESASTTTNGRVLYVVLLLGRGPQKVESALPVPPSHAVSWPDYVSRGPQAVDGAQLAIGHSRHRSTALTDVEELARTSLDQRKKVLIPKEIGKTVAQEAIVRELGKDDPGAEWLGRLLFSIADRADLRHWSTLPASCQVLRVPLSESVAACDLEYLAPDGRVVDHESFDLPPSWSEGPLFITRRMP